MKKWFIGVIAGILTILALIAGLVLFIDPYFHFHGPISGISYRLGNQRYMNDGIARNYDYDAVIIGTSMTENFKATQFDELFQVNSVKLPYAGASYREISESLKRCFHYNDHITTVLWAIDYDYLQYGWDNANYSESEYPTYLYDDNGLNDIKYLFNKEVLMKGLLPDLLYTIMGTDSTSMDDYSKNIVTTGADAVLFNAVRPALDEEIEGLTEEEINRVTETIQKNFVEVIEAHPNTVFYLYFTPYSIAEIEDYVYSGVYRCMLERQKIAAEILLEYDNVKLYCFFDEFDMICNLDNYWDAKHYDTRMNEQILRWMCKTEHQLTTENLNSHLESLYEYYKNFNYDSLYAKNL